MPTNEPRHRAASTGSVRDMARTEFDTIAV